MYPVSEAFLRAVQENTRRYYWTGKITTKGGAVYPFGYEDIVKGSGYVSAQCCGSAEIELGTVYAAEMGVTLFSQIDRYTLDGAKVELFYHLQVAEGKAGASEVRGGAGDGGAGEAQVFQQFFGFYHQVYGGELHEPADADGGVLCAGYGRRADHEPGGEPAPAVWAGRDQEAVVREYTGGPVRGELCAF